MAIGKCGRVLAYPSDGWMDGKQAQQVTPPAGQKGPGAGAVQAEVAQAWLQRNQGEDSGGDWCGLFLRIREKRGRIYLNSVLNNSIIRIVLYRHYTVQIISYGLAHNIFHII